MISLLDGVYPETEYNHDNLLQLVSMLNFVYDLLHNKIDFQCLFDKIYFLVFHLFHDKENFSFVHFIVYVIYA